MAIDSLVDKYIGYPGALADVRPRCGLPPLSASVKHNVLRKLIGACYGDKDAKDRPLL